MKAEDTDIAPVLNLIDSDGDMPQARNEAIISVLLTDQRWYQIVKGSFKYYRHVLSKDRIVPYVQFDAIFYREGVGLQASTEEIKRVQVFPASVAGWIADDE